MFLSFLLLWIVWLASMAPSTVGAVSINDNTRPAGRLEENMLNVRLYAGVGSWRPEGQQGAPIEIAAFGEEGVDLSIPGPLIRVREGTTIVLTLRNALGSELRVNGLCSRPSSCDSVSVPAGTSKEIRFNLNAPGTYFYWAATGAGPVGARPPRESQLGGAVVVDPREGSPANRIFVISKFGDPAAEAEAEKSHIFTINGSSWPHTEKLHHEVGDRVRWRIINLGGPHAMHLHGFYFTVEATGDMAAERRLAPDQQRTAVTENVAGGRTFLMSWTPERPGNWLFHCHMTNHMNGPADGGHAGHGTNDSAAGMGGLVIGIEVTGASMHSTSADERAPRRLSLVMREEPKRYGNQVGYRMDLEGAEAPRLNSGPVPGPVIVLTRGEPVEITLVNRMTEPTAIHWHGIELDSYFDGVPGYGGQTGNLAPPVNPGQSFVAKFTPPRAGTFIYHTHWHKDAQLAGGLYGALIVFEPGERYDPAIDHIVVIGLNGILTENEREPFALNGSATPPAIIMRAGVPNRLRLINITSHGVNLTAFITDRFEQTTWKPLAKDGATLPAGQTTPRPARQLVSVGETYDFEIQPRSQQLWLEVRRGNGEWVLQAPIKYR